MPGDRPSRSGASVGRPGVLTHCNAGGLATADYGTALAVPSAAEVANGSTSMPMKRPLPKGPG